MRRVRELVRRLRVIFGRRDFDRQLDAEIRFHLEKAAEQHVQSGMSPAESRRAARRRFGSPSRLKEETWDVWGLSSLEAFLGDLRVAWLRLIRNWRFPLLVSLLLTVSIGASTAVFSLVDRVVFRPLPVQSPEELVAFATPRSRGPRWEFYSYPYFDALRARDDIFGEVYAISTRPLRLRLRGETTQFVADLVSQNYFSGLGLAAHLGRTLESSDYAPDAGNVVVLSYAMWQQRFGGDPDILKREIQVEDLLFTVIGVSPRDFRGTRVGTPVDVWIPLSRMEEVVEAPPGFLENPLFNNLFLLARLRPGMERSEASAAATSIFRGVSENAIADRLARDPGFTENAAQEYLAQKVDVLPAAKGLSFVRDYNQTRLLVFLAAVIFVQLLACTNIAGLLLVRGERQSREVAIRMAIGAGRRRIIRQHLMEAVIIASMGSVGGLVLASALVEVVPRLLLPGVGMGAGLDGRVVGFTLFLSAFTTLRFSLYPAVETTRIRLTSALKQVSGGTGTRRFGLRRVVVVSQVAFSVVLLVAAGLFLRTLTNLYNLDFGYEPDHLLQVSLDPGNDGYEPSRAFAFWQDVARDVRAQPEVVGASVGMLGLVKDRARLGLPNANVILDDGSATTEGAQNINFDLVGGRYFETVRIPVLVGRDFRNEDLLGNTRVVVVNEALARRFFNGENPVGRRIGLAGDQPLDIEIVGMVADAKISNLRDERIPFLWFPYTQSPIPQGPRIQAMTLLVRTAAAPELLAGAVRSEITRIAPALPVGSIETTTSRIDDHLQPERSLAVVIIAFASIALLLAALGLYGIIAHSIAGRTRELGIRISVGAEWSDIVRLVLRRESLLVLLGAFAGAVGGVAVMQLVRSQLYGVEPASPEVMATVVLVLMGVCALAIYPPVRRAVKLDPVRALRHE